MKDKTGRGERQTLLRVRECPGSPSNELTHGGSRPLISCTCHGPSLEPSSQSKSEKPISLVWNSQGAHPGQPAGARRWGAEGGIELGVSHSELGAPAGQALDQKQTARRDRQSHQRILELHQTLRSHSALPQASQIRTTPQIPTTLPFFNYYYYFKGNIPQPPMRKSSLSSTF